MVIWNNLTKFIKVTRITLVTGRTTGKTSNSGRQIYSKKDSLTISSRTVSSGHYSHPIITSSHQLLRHLYLGSNPTALHSNQGSWHHLRCTRALTWWTPIISSSSTPWIHRREILRIQIFSKVTLAPTSRRHYRLIIIRKNRKGRIMNPMNK
jgi:hypothetical protein